ncbi:MAG: hypothetical protein Q7R54_01875 [bacterium]|nr:hypothetical protein [bacterium]
MSLTARNALIALGITVLIVGTIAYAIQYLDRQRIAEISAIEDQIAIDTLSLETQFSLLASAPCESATSTELIAEFSDLGERLSYTESQLGSNNAQVIQLKKQYTLLEIRDYLATKQLAAACGLKPVTVLYFYSNAGDCTTCDRAGYTLSYLHDTYPALRVYSFDYHLDLGALKTLISIAKVKEEFPAFIVNGTTSYDFISLEDLESRFPKGALSTTTVSH